jgi:hypothetical protein
MIKKTFVALLIAVILGIGVLSVVNTTYAQDISTELTDDAYVPQPVNEAYTYEYQLQVGEQNGDYEPVMTRTRTQSRMGEYGDGECDGEPIQLRLQEHKSTMQMRQENQQMQDGSCNGECTPLRRGGQGN